MDFQPIDADNHYYEPLDAFTRHLDKKFRERGVQPVQDGKRVKLLVGGKVNRFVPNPTFDPIIVPGCLDPLFRGQIPEGVDPRSLMQTEPLRPEYQNRHARLESMDQQGLGTALLFPTLGCGIEEGLRDDIPATMASLSAFNRFLEDDWGFGSDDRLIAVPMISLADPDAAVAEVDSLLERGARMVHVRPAPVPAANGASRSLGDKMHDPIWARLAEASVPVAFHLGDSGYQRRFAGAWGARSEFGFGNSDPFAQLLVSDRPIQDTVASLVVHGVFARHPNLRVASIENGSDWLGVLAKHLKKQANQTPWVFADDPLETLRNHVWVTSYLEEDLTALAELIGIERILFGSDWPHGEGVAQPLDFQKELGAFDDAQVQMIMRDNCLDLLGAVALMADTAIADSALSNADLAEQVRAWLAEHWDPDLDVAEWWAMVAEAGWTAPHFTPEEGGRGLSRRAGGIVRSTFAAEGALRPPGGLGLLMAAPTILLHGTPEQIERLVPPILDGRAGWCQLFSEPGSGSDLAGLTTRAVRDGDRWIINGQKVWSSQAMEADHGMLLARTDFDVPKHAGISWFAFSLDQPGVTIRPLREMTGEAVFNEVFFDDAECADADLIGGQGNGWAVTQSTLFFERTGIGAGGSHAGFPLPGPKGGTWGRRAGDAAQDPVPGSNLTLSVNDIIDLARRTGRNTDPHIRQKIVQLITYTDIGSWNARRGKAEAARGGGQTVANIGKIIQTRIMKLSAEIAMEIMGADGTLASPDGPGAGRFSHALVFSAASSIYGGTDEIQRNIIGERVLGLPREANPDKEVPYGEVLRRIDSSHR